jgi:hypothetical protein
MAGAGCLTAILLIFVGGVMNAVTRGREAREEEKRWPKKEWGKDSHGSHYPLDGRWK